MNKNDIPPLSRGRIVSLVLAILISTSVFAVVFGNQGHGRYFTPILLWAALILLLGIVQILPRADIDVVFTRWRWVGVIQLLFVISVIVMPYKYEAYARYRDYLFIAHKYYHTVVANTGSLGFQGFDLVEHRLERRVYSLGDKDQRDELNRMLTSGELDHFILVYGIPRFDRVLLKQLLPDGILRKAGVSSKRPEDTLESMGFDVKLEPIDGIESGNIFLVKPSSRKE